MDVFLFANFFPYKKAEPFLVNEFEFTKKYAGSITTFTLYGDEKEISLSRSETITSFKPLLIAPENKKEILIKGLFNLSLCALHIKELFVSGILFSPKKLRWLITSFLITRLVMSSKSYKDLKKRIEQSPDPLLYFYWGDNLSWLIPYLKKSIKNKNLKIIIRLHGSDLYENIRDDYAPLRREIFSAVNFIVPISENGKHYLENKYPEFKDKLRISRLGVFDNGLNPHRFNEIKQVVSVSNLVPLKRIHLIFETLQESRTRIMWHHFGDGPLAEDLQQLMITKREGLQVKFYGRVANDTLMSFYQTQPADLFFNLSSTEGLPVSIMEAFSFGIPVVATDVGGTSELVNKDNGLLIEPDFNCDELAIKVDTLLNLEFSETEQLRLTARKIFEEKVWADRNYTSFYTLFKQLV